MSQFEIHVETDIDLDALLIEAARDAAVKTLHHQNLIPPASLTLLLTGDDRIRQLNRDFLGHDEVTDVLSFPAGEAWPESERYLGDIAISLPKAQGQATAAGHGIREEVMLLVVHGVLHLLDFDHADEPGLKLMSSVQNGILCSLGLEIADPFSRQ